MKRRSLFWKLYPSFVFISFISLISVTVISVLTFKSFYYKQREADLQVRANIVKAEFTKLVRGSKFSQIQKRVKELALVSQTRYTILDDVGKVLGDSNRNPQEMDNHQDRPEVSMALKRGAGVSMRYSHTLKEELMYFATPLVEEGRPYGFIRTAIPVSGIQEALIEIYYNVVVGFLLLVLITSAGSWWVSNWLSFPLARIKAQAQLIAQGDYTKSVQVFPSDSVESYELAQTINEISVQLEKKIETITSQAHEQETVFSSMIEGVIALDLDERIINLNQAARNMFDVDDNGAKGKTLQEVIRNSDLQAFVHSSIQTRRPSSEEILIQNGSERIYIYVQSSPLFDSTKRNCGLVVVVNNITKLRELESHRKDFVANVSHELRTPLTSIQGFAETLLNPSVSSEADKTQFVKIIFDHAVRLGAIIEDLLTLSQVEKETDQKEVKLELAPIKPILEHAVELVVNKAQQSHIDIQLTCRDDLQTKLNGPLLEQAVLNLLENAIKYGNEKSPIVLSAELEHESIVIAVSDRGAGIASEHLPRIFERFYRVDKARNRKVGGTGLGLAIVKHIALAHGGRVEVKSEVNKGSTFFIHLPI